MSGSERLARALLGACEARGIKAVTAESCTGGMIAAALTDIAGSSAVFDRGFVTYSNAAKIEMLGVPAALIATHGAVSEQTAVAMAAGALDRTSAGLALSVTGIAGPDGGTAEKPVGLVWFGVAVPGRPALAERRLFENGGRAFIRAAAVRTALELVLAALGQDVGGP